MVHEITKCKQEDMAFPTVFVDFKYTHWQSTLFSC